MPWQILIVGSVISYSVSVILQRRLAHADGSNPKAYAVVFQLLCGSLVALYAAVSRGLVLPDVQGLILPLILMTVLYGLGNVFVFTALKQIDASRFIIIFALRALVTVLVASVLFGERLTGMQAIGILLVLAGVVIVNSKAAKLSLSKKELPALIAALLFGLANVNDRALLQSMDLYTFVALAYLLPSAGLVITDPAVLQPIKELLRPAAFKPMLLLSVVYVVGSVLFFAALQRATTASQVAIANLSSVVLIVLLAATFLKERDDLPKKMVAALVTFVGLVLVG